MKISNQTKAGVLAVVAIGLLIFGFNYLKGLNIFNKGTNYHVMYENASGLKVGDPVLITGLDVGKVKSINLLPDHSGVDVVLNITEKVDIPSDSKAAMGGDLLGGKYVQIVFGASKENILENGTLKGELDVDIQSQLKLLSGKINLMITSIDTTINILSSIFTEKLKDDFAKSITGIKQTLESFNTSAAHFNALLTKESPKIDTIISGVSSFTINANDNKERVNKIIQNLQTISDSLSAIQWKDLADEVKTATENINAILLKMQSSDGTAGMLLNDKQLYDNLNTSLQKLQAAIDQFNKNPQIKLKLFGK